MDKWQETTNTYFSHAWEDQIRTDAASKSSPYLDLEWHIASWQSVMTYWAEIFEHLAPGRDMLECGGATGRLQEYLAPRGWNCTVTDITPEAVTLAQSRMTRAGIAGQALRADVRSLPFADGSFDVVTSHGLLDVLSDIDLPIREMTRVLAPGGLFTATVYPRRFSVQTLADLALMVPRSVRRLVQKVAPKTLSAQRASPVPVFRNDYGLEEYVRACKAAGLRNIVATGVMPWPRLYLPAPLQRAYIRLIRRLEPLNLMFNRSRAGWTSHWGMMLALHGTKGTDSLPLSKE